MKSFLLCSFLFLIAAVSTTAQNEYFNNGASWGMRKGETGPYYGEYSQSTYTGVLDTLINNIIYKKLIAVGYWKSYAYGPGVLNPYDNETPYAGVAGYYRSEEMKIFRYNFYSDAEELIYDFDVAIGDTLVTHESITYDPMVVTDITTMMIGGEERNVYTVDFEGAVGNTVIEGIGHMFAGLDGIAYLNVSIIADQLLCYSYNEAHYSIQQDEIIETDEPCAFAVGVDELKVDNKLAVYPNPAEQGSIVTLIADSFIDSPRLKVMDMNGRLLMTANWNGNKSSFPINLVPGIYFVELNGNNSAPLTQKLVVQ